MTEIEARLTVAEAAAAAGRHIETIREALRSEELHGTQRVKGGTWRVKSGCLEAWMDGEECEHRSRRPVSISSYRRAS